MLTGDRFSEVVQVAAQQLADPFDLGAVCSSRFIFTSHTTKHQKTCGSTLQLQRLRYVHLHVLFALSLASQHTPDFERAKLGLTKLLRRASQIRPSTSAGL
jgi:hypothetical protein